MAKAHNTKPRLDTWSNFTQKYKLNQSGIFLVNTNEVIYHLGPLHPPPPIERRGNLYLKNE